MLFKSLFVLLAIHWIISQRNNVCEHFLDYFYPDFCSTCHYDPVAELNSSEIIAKYLPNSEVHTVRSEDGYITTMFRMPRNNSKGVILLHHSIATDSRLFLWSGNESFAFQLWNEGFEVWLTNHRGTVYSQEYETRNLGYEYWNFSFHDIATNDVGPELTYINGIVKEKIIFFGHSLGATIGLIYSSLHAEEAHELVDRFIFVAVPYTFKGTTSPIMWFTGLEPSIRIAVETLRIGQSVLFLGFLRHYTHYFIRVLPWILPLTNLMVSVLVGWTPHEMDRKFFNFDGVLNFDNYPFKMLIHFMQLLKREEFRMYDYGSKQNLIVYGNVMPPEYPISEINVPVLLISSLNDTLITSENVASLYHDLPYLNGSHQHWILSGLNHLGYFVGRHRYEIFTERLLNYLHTHY